MLSHLVIKNFGLIDHIECEFNAQLNIFTGETGAGKSIIIDALRIALGHRFASSFQRDQEKPSTIQATFELSETNLKQLSALDDLIDPDEPQLIIQRTLTSDGKQKSKVNGLSVTLSQLKEIGNHLIDFHGPHDHQMLLASASHLGMLDRLIDFGQLKEQYRQIYVEYKELHAQINKLTHLTQTRDRDVDLLSHQVKELEQVALNEEEYEQILQEQIKVNNAERLHEHVTAALQAIDNGDHSMTELIRQCFSPLHKLNTLDESTSKLSDVLNQIQELNDQLMIDLQDYAQSLTFNPQEAETIHQRCDFYDNILRKYGPTIADAQSFYDEASKKLSLLENLEHNDAELRTQMKEKESQLKGLAKKISGLRKKAADQLKVTIEQELGELGIKHVLFEAKIISSELNDQGIDEVIFYISPNAGESLKPLADIVSSGEAARVMLALKKALIKVDPIPVLIFDEIDAQIGGRLGTVTGQKLRDISRHRQVLLITHLPQIASFADIHFKVCKKVEKQRTVTDVILLDKKSRVDEIAQMMSGDHESKIAVKHAQDLLVKAGKN